MPTPPAVPASQLSGAGTSTLAAATFSQAPVCIQHLRQYQSWGAFTDANGNVGPLGSAAPTCSSVAANGGMTVTAAGTYPSNAFPGVNGGCAANASSAACASCAAGVLAYAGWNYLSPVVCHGYLTNLVPGATYQFTIATSVVSTATANAAIPVGTTAYTTPSSTIAQGVSTYNFNAPPPPSGPGSNQAVVYPYAAVLMADVGVTYNSSLTAQFVASYDQYLTNTNAGGLDLVINVGDFTYGAAPFSLSPLASSARGVCAHVFMGPCPVCR